MRLFCLAITAVLALFVLLPNLIQAGDVTLAWDPNYESKLAGYGIYSSRGTSGPPYHLVAFVDLSEIDNADSPTFTVQALMEGTPYSLAVTAYDSDGNESGYSDPVCIEVGTGQIDCAPSAVNSEQGHGGGGGGAGCFLSIALQ